MTVRPVAARDVHAIAELQVRAWRAEHDGVVDEDRMPTVEDRIGLWNGVRPGEAWLAEDDDGAIVGVVGVTNGEIGVLHVDPALPGGHGIDDRLLKHAEDVMRSAGHTTALLWTFVGNQHNRALYERHGWERDGVEEETLPGVTEIRYRRVL
jgi:ribosomal protein S18 acetylase RimI-like enzyme